MAKIKYSALVSDMRNKLNGSVMSKNRYGSYVRNKVTPVNPQTSFQQAARQVLGNLSSSFRDLSLQAIKAWNSKAKEFPFTDIFGDTRHLTGQTLFVKLNANLEKIGLPRVTEAPSPTGFPVLELVKVDIAIDSIADLTLVDFEVSPKVIPAGFSLVAYATPPLSKSRSFVKNEYRFMGAVTPSAAGIADISTPYIARFGDPIVGENVHIKIALIANDTGQQSVPLDMSGIVESL